MARVARAIWRGLRLSHPGMVGWLCLVCGFWVDVEAEVGGRGGSGDFFVLGFSCFVFCCGDLYDTYIFFFVESTSTSVL